jgi:hypothetical protein
MCAEWQLFWWMQRDRVHLCEIIKKQCWEVWVSSWGFKVDGHHHQFSVQQQGYFPSRTHLQCLRCMCLSSLLSFFLKCLVGISVLLDCMYDKQRFWTSPVVLSWSILDENLWTLVLSLCCSCVQALDKIRFLSLTDKSVLGEGDESKLDIHVRHLRATNAVYTWDVLRKWVCSFCCAVDGVCSSLQWDC